jgi:hypothetical protein
MHAVPQVLDQDLNLKLPVRERSLVPLMARSVRILLTSHDRCWSVPVAPGP